VLGLASSAAFGNPGQLATLVDAIALGETQGAGGEADLLDGWAGNDVAVGWSGADGLLAGDGADVLVGMGGDDRIAFADGSFWPHRDRRADSETGWPRALKERS
jgi:Ca2+-binding RTX toxin-like protein